MAGNNNVIQFNGASTRVGGPRGKCQTVENSKKTGTPVSTDIPSEVRRSITDRVAVHGQGIQRAARANGVGVNDAVSAIVHELTVRIGVAWEQGYRAGRERPLPPTTGPAVLKRVA